MTENSLEEDAITTSGPTEDGEDRDKGGDGTQDTGDLPTEAEDDKDAGGEGGNDTGDEA